MHSPLVGMQFGISNHTYCARPPPAPRLNAAVKYVFTVMSLWACPPARNGPRGKLALATSVAAPPQSLAVSFKDCARLLAPLTPCSPSHLSIHTKSPGTNIRNSSDSCTRSAWNWTDANLYLTSGKALISALHLVNTKWLQQSSFVIPSSACSSRHHTLFK